MGRSNELPAHAPDSLAASELVPRVGLHTTATRPAGDRLPLAVGRVDPVVAGSAREPVASGPAGERVPAAAAREPVAPGAAGQRVPCPRPPPGFVPDRAGEAVV